MPTPEVRMGTNQVGDYRAAQGLETIGSVYQFHDEFNRTWKHGIACPRIEFYVEQCDEDSREELIRELLPLDIEYRSASSFHPSVAEYERRLSGIRRLARHVFLTHRSNRTSSQSAKPDRPIASHTRIAEPSATDAKWPETRVTSPDQHVCDGSSIRSSSASTVYIPFAGTEQVGGRDRAPSRLGRFGIQEVLGEGAFGVVYRAHDPQLDRQVALKVPRMGLVETPEAAERFLREARAAAALHHPNIVAVFDANEADNTLYIASALVEGASLRDAVSSGRRFTHQEAAAIVSRIARALDYAHENGVVHRDIKPANILVDRAGNPHIADFGLARRSDSDGLRTEEGVCMGTPAYMSPEQASGRSAEADGRSDQWSLGVMFFELLAGRRLFEAENIELLLSQVRSGALPPLRQIAAEIPLDLVTICEKCLAVEPAERFGSCGLLADEIERWMRGEPILSRPISRLERLRRWSKRNPALARLAAAVSLLVMVAIFVAAGLILSRRELLATEDRLRDEQSRLETSLSTQQLLTSQADDAAELARKNAELASLRELEARQNLERFVSEKRTSGRLSQRNQLLEGEHSKLQSAISHAEGRLEGVGVELSAKEQQVRALNQKLADATWQEYATWLAAADIGWMKKEPVEIARCLARCPEEFRGWEWHFLQKHAQGDFPEPVAQPLLVGIKNQTETRFGVAAEPNNKPSLPYQVDPRVALSSDGRRIGIWVTPLDENGRTVTRQANFAVADLDATSIASAGNVYDFPWLVNDSRWHEKTMLSDDGRFLAAAGRGANRRTSNRDTSNKDTFNRRRFLQVVDLSAQRSVVREKWTDGLLPDLSFSESNDRFFAAFPDGDVIAYAITDDLGAPAGTVLQKFSLASLIGAQSCRVQSAILHHGGMFAVVVTARVDRIGQQNLPVLVLWDDRVRELGDDSVFVLPLPPEFADVPAERRGQRPAINHQFKIIPSTDATTLAVVGKSTALVDLRKHAIVGEFPLPNVIGFSYDGKRLLELGPKGQLDVWDVATGRKLPTLKILRRAVEFLRTLRTRFSLEEEKDSWYRFDASTVTFHVLKRDEIREVTQLGKPDEGRTRVTIRSYFVLGRLCLQAP